MKIFRIYLSLVACLAVLLAAGCSKFDDTNISPNATNKPVTSALLTNVESYLGSDALGATSTTNGAQLGVSSLYTGFLVQHYSDTQYPLNSLYITSSISWDNYYVAVLQDLFKIIKENTANPNPLAEVGNSVNQIQIARILKAYFFSIVTDKYGDVPYFNALKGDLKITYDKQQDIYNDLFKELKSAGASFESTGNPIKGDIVYNGDIAKWKKFANSLRLSLALRLSKVDVAKGKTEFLDALADPNGIIADNADNFTLKYPGGTFNHPFFGLTLASFFAISEPMANLMNGYGDPRVFKYGEKNASGNVKGFPYGLNKANAAVWLTANPDYSKAYDVSLKANNSSAYIFTAAYVNLMRAEAVLTYGTGEDALALLTKGINDSWAQWGVTGDIAAYLTKIGVTATPALATIQEQTWIALFGSEMNAWNENRRTGIPVLKPAQDAQNSPKTIPRRYVYPSNEISLNAEAYKAAAASIPYGGKDNEVSRVWWDKP